MDIRNIPYDAIVLRFFETGRLDGRLEGRVHCKTCPYAILAQAVQGRYEIQCGPDRYESLAQGEAFLVQALQPLRIVHHGDPREHARLEGSVGVGDQEPRLDRARGGVHHRVQQIHPAGELASGPGGDGD